MRVIAKEGVRVPREEDPRKYVSDSQAEEVDITPYYLRRMADGDLIEQRDNEVQPVDLVVQLTASPPAGTGKPKASKGA